jgi:hypothetical protein
MQSDSKSDSDAYSNRDARWRYLGFGVLIHEISAFLPARSRCAARTR